MKCRVPSGVLIFPGQLRNFMLKVIADPGVSDGRVATAGNAFGFCEGKVYTNLEYFVGLYASLHKR